MKSLTIQLQPWRAAGLDALAEAERLLRVVEASGHSGSVRVAEGDDEGRSINIDLRTANVAALWPRLRGEWQPGGSLAQCSIVCCEGDGGWDDYRLLHHFDPSESLDDAE